MVLRAHKDSVNEGRNVREEEKNTRFRPNFPNNDIINIKAALSSFRLSKNFDFFRFDSRTNDY